MATLFASDFETAGLPEWDTKANYALVGTPLPASGNLCVRATTSGFNLIEDFGGAQLALYARFYVRWSNLEIPISPARNLCQIYGAGGSETFWLFLDSPASDTVLALNTGAFGNTFSTTALESDTWYCIEIYCEISATANIYVWLDQNLVITQSGDNSAYNVALDTIEMLGDGYGTEYDEQYIDYLEVNTEHLECGVPTRRRTHVIEIRGDEKRFLRLHYIKNHPSPFPDTFDMKMVAEDADDINYWDIIDVRKDGVTEFIGFVEEKTPDIGENGLEYIITGRCWKVVEWKKWTERFVETREIGPSSETGFFGKVYPREAIMFFLRTPISIHPAGKVRHKIGWGIPSGAWVATANRTWAGFAPAWAICRHVGFAWRNGTQAVPQQLLGDFFQIDLGEEYMRVTSILIESRRYASEDRFARNFEIQLSRDGVSWTVVRSFDGNGARDILASWSPVNNVRYVRIYITLTRTDVPEWEISQVYVFQAEEKKYRLLDETEVNL